MVLKDGKAMLGPEVVTILLKILVNQDPCFPTISDLLLEARSTQTHVGKCLGTFGTKLKARRAG